MLNINWQNHTVAGKVNNILSCMLTPGKPAVPEWVPLRNAQKNNSQYKNT